MAIRKLPDWIRGYLNYTTETESPTVFHLWTAIWTIAGALRRKVYMEFGNYQFVPNFYIILVAPPGVVSKTTTLGIGQSLLNQIPNIVHGPNSVTWQRLVQIMSEEAQVSFSFPDGSMQNMCAINFAVNELATFLRADDQEMLPVLVDLWDSKQGPWRKGAKLGDDTIINPWINIIAGTTPSWIKDHMPEKFITSGFTSRCIFVSGHKKRQLIAYPKAHLSEEMKQLKQNLIDDLGNIADLAGSFTMTPEAEAWGEAWYRNYWLNCDPNEDNYAARLQAQVHKVAMVLSVAESDSLIIDECHLKKASVLMESVQEQMALITKEVETTSDMAMARSLFDKICRVGEIKDAELYTSVQHRVSYKQFFDAIQSLKLAGLIRIEKNTSGQHVFKKTG